MLEKTIFWLFVAGCITGDIIRERPADFFFVLKGIKIAPLQGNIRRGTDIVHPLISRFAIYSPSLSNSLRASNCRTVSVSLLFGLLNKSSIMQIILTVLMGPYVICH